jgi:hypothetical protein
MLSSTTLLWFCLAAASADDDAAAREAGMFGDNAAAAPAADAAPTTDGDAREDALFGAPSAVVAVPASSTLLDDAAAFTTFGGNVFLRLNGSLREDVEVLNLVGSSPSLIDVFTDVRPNDRVRGFAQARLVFDFTQSAKINNPLTGQPGQPFQLLLDQAWMKFDIGRVAYVTAGRQRIRWGTGRFWNPTDFVNTGIRNSVDFFDNRVGVNLVKFHFPFELLGWNLYILSVLENARELGQVGVAARAEIVVGPMELAISSQAKKDTPLRFGADISSGVGVLDIRAEAVMSRGSGRPRFEGKFDLRNGQIPEEVDVSEEWFFQGVAGAEMTVKVSDTDSVSFGAEYFYNQTGYPDASLYPVIFFRQQYVPLYTGRHYLALYAFMQSPFDFDDLTITASTLANLSDSSALSRLDVQVRVLQYLTWNVFAAVHYGATGEFHLGFNIEPVPVTGLENGFILARDNVDMGTALRLAF